MNTKSMTVEEAQRDIGTLRKRIAFNNSLNAYARKFRREHDLSKFNGYWDEPTPEMREAMAAVLTGDSLGDTSWMSSGLREKYASDTSAIFAGIYSAAVNTYVLNDLHDCERFIAAHEKAEQNPSEDCGLFRVERDTAENRMNLVFGGRPEPGVISALKSRGFRWSPSRQCWTRQLTQEAEGSLRRLKSDLRCGDGGTEGV